MDQATSALAGAIAESKRATRHAEQALAAHTMALSVWGKSGCDPAAAGEHERLAIVALEAARVADTKNAAVEAARKLLERSLTAENRVAALQAISDAGLAEFAASATRERPRNPAEVIAAASVDGQRLLDAHRKIAAGNRKGAR
jgi:hypothetical protein